jgi:NADP-dependent 3-hydroxy acid dehydrogenase YdfG
MSANNYINQVGIVTGASSDIGLGITQALLEHSYRVIAHSLTISKLKDLKPLFRPNRAL